MTENEIGKVVVDVAIAVHKALGKLQTAGSEDMDDRSSFQS